MAARVSNHPSCFALCNQPWRGQAASSARKPTDPGCQGLEKYRVATGRSLSVSTKTSRCRRCCSRQANRRGARGLCATRCVRVTHWVCWWRGGGRPAASRRCRWRGFKRRVLVAYRPARPSCRSPARRGIGTAPAPAPAGEERHRVGRGRTQQETQLASGGPDSSDSSRW